MSKTKTNRREKATSERSNSEVSRWLLGFALLSIGLFALASALFYFAHWKADFALLNGIGSDNPNFDLLEFSNPCGGGGAWIGDILIGRSFGAFGVVIPIFILLIGLKILRKQPLRLHRMALSSAMLLILGSLSLGFIFKESLAIFNSGLGGAYGISIAARLCGLIGSVGIAILLICGWVGFGVFVNRNFINTVNAAGQSAINRGGKIVDIVKDKVSSRGHTKESMLPEETTFNAHSREEEPSVAEVDAIDQKEVKEQQSPIVVEHPEQDDMLVVVEVEESASIEKIEPDLEIDRRCVEDEDLAVVDIVEPQSGLVVTVEANIAAQLTEDEVDDMELYDPLRDLNNYQHPPVNLLEDYQSKSEVSDEEIYENKSKIEDTLKHFGIPIQRIKATVGPTITLYEIVQAQGVKISKIQGLENDIAQSLKALGIRIIAPIPGRGTIGIEVPNRNKQVVSMLSSVKSVKFQESKAELPIVIGKTIQNENYVFDLAKMPHLLVAGATGQGKSVGLNAIITSLLYRKHPAELKFVMIDPKMVEFTPYKNLEHHFMAKMESEEEVIITDPKKAVYTLNSLCEEMESRLKLLSKAAVRNIVEYNNKFISRRLNPDKGHYYMPYIVVVVDEFADLIMMTREVETPVMRLAQKARAVGIHLIIATQRPDVKVITGGIKANFPARIAFRVMQMIDSRTIIDQPGANQLIGRGDMLFSKDGEMTRIQCALVETDEVNRVVEHISSQQGYTMAYRLPDYSPESGSEQDMGSESGSPVKYDSLFAEIARAAVANGSISTSAIQRNYEVGFNRAGRIMMQLERSGIVGKQEGAKPRDIYFHDITSLEAKLQDLGVF